MIQRTGTASGPATGKGEGGDKKREGKGETHCYRHSHFAGDRASNTFVRSSWFFVGCLRYLFVDSFISFVHFFIQLASSSTSPA